MPPSDRRYLKTHEWARREGALVSFGITDHAVHQLTDLTYVDLPAVGARVIAGDRFGEIESVKAVSDLYAPLSGEVVAVNEALSEEAGLEELTADPFGAGWMIRVRPDDPAALEALLSAEDYANTIGD